jgi:GT2 family glycosyltransferase
VIVTMLMHEELGFVVIGRNEGDRLRQCLGAISVASQIVYVDSGSSDGSQTTARSYGVHVVELDATIPFTAARARNCGFQELLRISPSLVYVQFIDGDCELSGEWLDIAWSFLRENPTIAVVSGRLRERYPERSIYNWLCDREWDVPSGEAKACGGIALMRARALQKVGGFREDLIAGEEPELCVRLRAAGERIWRLEADMALHDADMHRFTQWFRRTMRSGYAYAQGAKLHGMLPERHWVWESRRAFIWGLCLPLGCATCTLLFWPLGTILWSIYPAQTLRQMVRNSGTVRDRAYASLFQVLARFPEAIGQLKFMCDEWRRRRSDLIEYK